METYREELGGSSTHAFEFYQFESQIFKLQFQVNFLRIKVLELTLLQNYSDSGKKVEVVNDFLFIIQGFNEHTSLYLNTYIYRIWVCKQTDNDSDKKREPGFYILMSESMMNLQIISPRIESHLTNLELSPDETLSDSEKNSRSMGKALLLFLNLQYVNQRNLNVNMRAI